MTMLEDLLKTAEDKRDKAIEGIRGVCRKFDFADTDAHSGQLFVIREYAVPECIGCMVRVEYSVCVAISDWKAETAMVASMFRKPFKRDGDGDDCFRIYKTTIGFNYMDYETHLEWIESEIKDMFEKTERKINNILGMERMA